MAKAKLESSVQEELLTHITSRERKGGSKNRELESHPPVTLQAKETALKGSPGRAGLRNPCSGWWPLEQRPWPSQGALHRLL